MTIRLPLWASVFTLIGFVILILLGLWQIERLQWKRDLLARFDAAYETKTPPQADSQALKKAEPLTRVLVRGQYDHDREMLITPRTWKGKVGFHLVTPLWIKGGGIILINRGWIPAEKKAPQTRPETLQMGTVEVAGLLREPQKPGLFTPPNDPITKTYFYIDPAFAVDKGKAPAPFILYADSETGSSPLLVQEALRWAPRNNHLGYAIFWFSMAGILLAVYYIRFLHNQTGKE